MCIVCAIWFKQWASLEAGKLGLAMPFDPPPLPLSGPVCAQALRPLGVKLMKAVVKRFGDVADPLAEGQKLLELYQAQVVSAIRSVVAGDVRGHSEGSLLQACP